VLPRQLVQSYRHAAGLLGAEFLEDTEVVGIDVRDGGATVHTLTGTVEADRVVISAGAWSSRFGAALGTDIPVFPVRGQIAAIKGMPLPVRHVVYSYNGYAVPWPDGRLLLGATQEEAGYAAHTTVDGILQVVNGGRRLIPSVGDAEIDDIWAGLRPGSPDTMPYLGPVKGRESVWLATGHYRNGVLLGPYTARLLAEAMAENRVSYALQPFQPGRPV
jgi:glycine oxidase